MDGTTAASSLRSLAVRRCQHRGAGVFAVADTRCRLLVPWRTQDLPSSRTDPIAASLMFLRPRRRPDDACLDASSDAATGEGTSVALSMPFRGSITWLDQLAVYASKCRGSPGTMQDSLHTCAATLWWAGFSPAGSALKSFSYVFSSHHILLSRAYLAQSPLHSFLGSRKSTGMPSQLVRAPSASPAQSFRAGAQQTHMLRSSAPKWSAHTRTLGAAYLRNLEAAGQQLELSGPTMRHRSLQRGVAI